MRDNFHKNLRRIMDEKKITGEQIAEVLDISTSTVIHWANGRRFPRKEEYITELANFLGVKVAELFGEEYIRPSKIPLIGEASCGVPSNFYNDDVEWIDVPSDLARDGVYCVRANGDSMLPKISHGDIVVCDKEQECLSGNIVHYTLNDESGIKKLTITDEATILTPLNQDYAPIIVKKEDDFRCAKAIRLIQEL